MDPYGPVWVRMVPGDSLGASWGLLGPSLEFICPSLGGGSQQLWVGVEIQLYYPSETLGMSPHILTAGSYTHPHS